MMHRSLQQFLDYHEANPEVWGLFKRFTFDVMNTGRRRYGGQAILERVRWESDIQTHDPSSDFKVNDHFVAYYTRLFTYAFPHRKGFFELRRLRRGEGAEEETRNELKALLVGQHA